MLFSIEKIVGVTYNMYTIAHPMAGCTVYCTFVQQNKTFFYCSRLFLRITVLTPYVLFVLNEIELQRSANVIDTEWSGIE